jgi:hypothetical protein
MNKTAVRLPAYPANCRARQLCIGTAFGWAHSVSGFKSQEWEYPRHSATSPVPTRTGHGDNAATHGGVGTYLLPSVPEKFDTVSDSVRTTDVHSASEGIRS